MFAKSEENDITIFEECMSIILGMYQNKIYSSDKDFLGVVFFGTEKSNTGDDFVHINMIQVDFFDPYFLKIHVYINLNEFYFKDLDQPSAERIKQIENFGKGILIIRF
jgi:hypothetical protein